MCKNVKKNFWIRVSLRDQKVKRETEWKMRIWLVLFIKFCLCWIPAHCVVYFLVLGEIFIFLLLSIMFREIMTREEVTTDQHRYSYLNFKIFENVILSIFFSLFFVSRYDYLKYNDEWWAVLRVFDVGLFLLFKSSDMHALILFSDWEKVE